jgi:hypothetical protein
MERGFKGNGRAAQAAMKTGMQIVFDEKEAEPVRKESPKWSVDLKKLNDEELAALAHIMTKGGVPTAGSGIDAADEKPSDETCPKTSKK